MCVWGGGGRNRTVVKGGSKAGGKEGLEGRKGVSEGREEGG